MIISTIILLISIVLDGILSNFLPFLVNGLSLFTTMLTVIAIFMIYPFFRKKEKNYFITIFIVGMIYDLLYTNLVFFNGVLFLIIGFISLEIYKNFEISYLKLIIYLILIISAYEILTGIILLVFNMVPVTLYKVLYKITHSLILNIVYGELIYLIINLIPKKYRKISIN